MIVLYILLILLSPFILLLFVPVRYKAAGGVGGRKFANIYISWFFRLVQIRYIYEEARSKTEVRIAGRRLGERRGKPARKIKKTSAAGGKPAKRRKSAAAPKKETRKQPEKGGGFAARLRGVKAVLTEIDIKIMMSIFKRFCKKTARALKPDAFDAEGTFGFDDPRATGLALGAYEAAAGYLRLRRHVRLTGYFDGPMLSLEASAEGRIAFGPLLWPVIWLCTRKPVFTLLKRYLKRKKDE